MDLGGFDIASRPTLLGLPLTQTASGGYVCEEDPGEVGYEPNSKRGSVSPGECDILSALCRSKSVLEIGTGLGVSTRAIASTARHVLTVDIDPWVKDRVWPELLVDCRNVEASSEWPDDLRLYDVIFVDGNHGFDSVKSDATRAVFGGSSPGTLVIFHDLHLFEVVDAVRACGLIPFRLDTPMRLGLVTVPLK